MRLTTNVVKTLTLPEGKSEAIIFDDDLPGFGIRLRAGGSRTWVFQYKLGKKNRRMSIGNANAVAVGDARANAAKLHARVKLSQDPAAEKTEARLQASESFGAIVERYLADQQGQLREASFRHVQRHLTAHAKPLHGLRVDKIARRDIATCIGSVKTKSGPVAGNRTRAALSAFFSWAMGEGLAEHNPVIGTNLSEERPRERVLEARELALIWNALGDGQYADIMRLLMLTGSRANEIAGLRWSEIDGDTVKLPGERTKNGKAHLIPLAPAAAAIIAARPKLEGRDLIFGRSNRGPFGGWTKAKRTLDAAIAKASGKPLPPWVVHDLRRSAATHMAEIGIQPHIIEAILNHVSGHKAGVAGIYNRASYDKEKRQALAIWAEHLLAMVEDRKSNVVALKA